MSSSDLATRISNRLAKDILTGTIEPGTHVATQQIADRYQVSRTPVRDALVALSDKGLLEHQANRGYFVPEEIPEGLAQEIAAQDSEESDVYQTFAEDWLKNRLTEIVTEQSLRQRYSLTKSRLNDMMARAAREGWAERKEGYGWRLLPVAKTSEAFDQIYRFRLAIEPVALLEPSFELDRKVLAEHRRIQEWMLEVDVARTPPEQLLANGAAFHEALIAMSNNPFFASALERVNRMRRLMEYRARVDQERLQVQCSDHIEIIDLLERGEVVEASYFMRRHLSGALRRKSPIARNWSEEMEAEAHSQA
ncbi:GntR family transcriptional regulator [Marinovum sp. 2_MG-2023]|uniref:GntR family transcriptional regulator n=1 Tax=Roseobacteraceae TaxID=2854170 RepID=UPI001FCF8A14|nr:MULTISPECIES: GntR family transcriptional regulator [Roseobacteraceae]MCJ7872810.1 GntR family transcriptional regulator [Phaeobacter sp. J2-8]MDO6730032.1 GntR family transcriptional regulator [Marinovum sp. 2_MG-2023]MDO6779846.1 GntR family transcriptional regulator [Marinovum sp. 1_MG-2023]